MINVNDAQFEILKICYNILLFQKMICLVLKVKAPDPLLQMWFDII